MSKIPRRNINFRQTAREFRAIAASKIAGRVQRLFPYTRYHTSKIWTIITKPAKIWKGIKGRQSTTSIKGSNEANSRF